MGQRAIRADNNGPLYSITVIGTLAVDRWAAGAVLGKNIGGGGCPLNFPSPPLFPTPFPSLSPVPLNFPSHPCPPFPPFPFPISSSLPSLPVPLSFPSLPSP